MVRFVVCALVVVSVGCGGGRATTSETALQSRGGADALVVAQQWERGTRGARDYAKAAAMYDAACRDGTGDLAACRRLVDAIVEARGVRRDLARVGALVDAMCKRDDLSACVVYATLLGLDGETAAPELQAKFANVDPEAECRKGNAGSCEAMLALEMPNFQGSSGLEEKQDDRADVACRARVTAGCFRLLEGLHLCAYEAGAERCARKLVDGWKEGDAQRELHAFSVVSEACDRGDAVACDVLPGREIDAHILCDAKDYGACANLGCLGDEKAAAIGKRYGAEPNCSAVGNREAAKHEPPPETRAAIPAEPARRLPPPRPLSAFRALAFRRLATEEDSWDWPEFAVTNLSNRPVIHVGYRVYAYDKAGTQVAVSEHESGDATKMQAHASVDPYRAVPTNAVAFDICYDFIAFEGDTQNAHGGTTAAARCPDQLAKGHLPPPLAGSGAAAQTPLHAALGYGRAAFATTSGLPAGASARGLEELKAGLTDFAASNEPSRDAGMLSIPVAVGAVGVVYSVPGVTALRLSPATLAKIFQRRVSKWNDPAIAKDNPRVKLPAIPIILYRPVGFDEQTDEDLEASRTFVEFLQRTAGAAWTGGAATVFRWPSDMKRVMGIDAMSSTDGAIAFALLSTAVTRQKLAAIRNRAGSYVAPTDASLRAAARDVDAKTGRIDAKDKAAYPIAFTTYVIVAAKQTDATRGALLVAYLRDLLGDVQASLDGTGTARLTDADIAASRKLVDSVAVP